MQPKKTGKRGRPANKKLSDDDGSGESFEHKMPKKRAPSKKNIEDKKKSKLTTKPSKSKVELVSSIDSFSDSDLMDDENHRKTVKIPVDVFNADLVFAQILNKANKQPEFLINLKNLLSGYSRNQEEKKSQYRKKWKLLRNSNCTQDQYLSRQSELKRTEAEEFNEFEEDIISKLAISQIKGFESKESILEVAKAHFLNGKIDESVTYVIDEKGWNSYRAEQKKLLEILMKENDFVSQDYKLVNMNMNFPQAPISNPSMKEEDNSIEMRFTNLETEENPQSTQFLFCKHYNNVNYDKVFENPAPFKISEEDKFYIDDKAMAWLLESKCDEIYTNQNFQKQTYNHYSKMLRELYNRPLDYTDKEVMDNLLEVGAYVLNSVHYYQKFKLKCDLLHPLDLMLVIDKLAKERQIKIPFSSEMVEEVKINEMVDEKDEIQY